VIAGAGSEVLSVLHVDAGREWRGGQNQLRLLARELEGAGCVRQTVATRPDSRLATEVRGAGVEVRPLSWRIGFDPRAVVGLSRAAARRDLLHAHSSHALQAAVAALALSGAPCRLVASRRTPFPPTSPGVWRRADVVLAVSSHVAGVLVRSGLEPRRVRVVHDGVDPDELRPGRSGALRTAAGVKDEVTLVGALGALTRTKDHATFLRAAARVAERRPDVHFVVVGEGPERARLERRVREVGLEGRFHLPGHVEKAGRSLPDLDLFVMPSRDEGLGSAVLEAVAAGVPALVVRAGGLADVARAGLPSVPPGDPEALAGAMARLLGDAAARRDAVRAGERALPGFTAAAMAAGTLRTYREVLARDRALREHLRLQERTARRRRARPPRGDGA
jgi:glycosyltransferase involved in cell wall biosynthesis